MYEPVALTRISFNFRLLRVPTLVPITPVFWLLFGAIIEIFSNALFRISPWLIEMSPMFVPPLTFVASAEVIVIFFQVRFSIVPERT